jgi:hypothetical protein
MNKAGEVLNKCYQIINLLENNIADKYNMPEVMKRLPWEDPSIIEYYVELGAELQDFLAYVNSGNGYGRYLHLRMTAESEESFTLTDRDTGTEYRAHELDCVVAL